jgi:DNA invertase Pin-like site-specific DNA recombinase
VAIAARTEMPGATLVYGRVSDDRADNLPVDRQLEDCWELVRARGWAVDERTDVYRDDGFSASRRAKKRRPRFDAMLDRIADGGVARVVVWATDRLYRDPRDLLRLSDLAERGVEVVTVTGGDVDLNTDDGRMRSGIMVYVAQREADGISTRVRRQKQQRREQGLPHGGRRPFGWRDLMEPDPVEAGALRDAMEAVVRGASMSDVAARWTAAGLGEPRRAVAWTGSDVRRVLLSPRHAGLVVHNGEIAVDNGGNEIAAAWPAIVSRDLWDACRSVLAARATGVGVARRRSMLTGLLRCGAPGCDATLTRSSTAARVIWRCFKGCGTVSIGAAPLEAVVVEALFEYVDSDELRTALAARDDGQVAAVRSQLLDVDRKLRELVDVFRGGESARAFRLASDALEADRRRLEVELGRASLRSPLEAYSSAPGVLRRAWSSPAMTTDQRRAAIQAAFGVVTVKPAAGRGRRFDPTRVAFGDVKSLTP